MTPTPSDPATTRTRTTTSASITRTALDALLSKWSAIAVGYKPIPKNELVYRNLLEGIMGLHDEDDDPIPKRRPIVARQSPLVSAGYAMRIAIMTHMVHSFVSFHDMERNGKQQQINIVLLGCGMDVLGLWANSLGGNVHVWEVDVPEIAQAKRDRLLQANLILEDETHGSTISNVVLEGKIKHESSRPKDDLNSVANDGDGIGAPCKANNYHLIGADLRNIASLDQSLGQAWKTSMSEPCPTLVVLELVLAYLEPIKTDQVLEWCASNILSESGSALIAFEALGECSHEQSTERYKETDRSVGPVVKAYQKSYTSQFQQKLDKGRSNNNQTRSMFHPLGSSCERVEQRIWRLTGYTNVHACTAGTAAQWATWQPGTTVRLAVPPGELFDEHAALSLHLASYTLVVAMTGTLNHEQFLVQQRLCPWYNQEWTWRILVSSKDDKTTSSYVTVIEPEDEEQVRSLFAKTYEDLAQTYAAVNKMVKSALKQELAQSASLQGSLSAVRQRYQRMGGQFFVAVQYPGDGGRRRVIGGIAVRRWNDCAKTTGQEMQTPTYEIHRFFVEKSCRGQGVGSALLHMAEALVKTRPHRFSNQCYRIAATTLSLLEEANHFYAKHGYNESGEESIGTLSLKTYSKEFACAMPGQLATYNLGTGQVPSIRSRSKAR